MRACSLPGTNSSTPNAGSGGHPVYIPLGIGLGGACSLLLFIVVVYLLRKCCQDKGKAKGGKNRERASRHNSRRLNELTFLFMDQ